MRLVATVAHPRKWKLQEKGLRELVKLLFHNDPRKLTRQLAAIGHDLTEPGASILIRNDAPAGLLYLFANDWWQTASNNSGGVQLSIARLAVAGEDAPLWTLQADGGWNREEMPKSYRSHELVMDAGSQGLLNRDTSRLRSRTLRATPPQRQGALPEVPPAE